MGIDLRSISILFLITKINIFLIDIFIKLHLCYSQWTVLIILINAHYISEMIPAFFSFHIYIIEYLLYYTLLYFILTHTHANTPVRIK